MHRTQTALKMHHCNNIRCNRSIISSAYQLLHTTTTTTTSRAHTESGHAGAMRLSMSPLHTSIPSIVCSTSMSLRATRLRLHNRMRAAATGNQTDRRYEPMPRVHALHTALRLHRHTNRCSRFSCCWLLLRDGCITVWLRVYTLGEITRARLFFPAKIHD